MIDKEQMMQPTPGLAMAFSWLVMLLFGLPMAWFGASNAWTKLDAAHWTPVRARVVSSDSYLRTGKQEGRCVRMRYAYQVGGREYTSRSVGTSMLAGAGCERHEADFQRRWGMVRPGLMVVARYDPDAPQRAALIAEPVDFFDWLFVLMGLAVIGAGAWEIWRQKKR